jgi:hypothetical protein
MMDNDDDVSFDYTPYGMVRNFVMKNIILLLIVSILVTAISVLAYFLVLPNVTYHVLGTVTRIDNAGLTVRIFSVDADVYASMVGTEIMVGSGICALQGWSTLCFIGAPVEATFQGNRLGQKSWSVTALVRGFEGNDTYVIEKTEK